MWRHGQDTALSAELKLRQVRGLLWNFIIKVKGSRILFNLKVETRFRKLHRKISVEMIINRNIRNMKGKAQCSCCNYVVDTYLWFLEWLSENSRYFKNFIFSVETILNFFHIYLQVRICLFYSTFAMLSSDPGSSYYVKFLTVIYHQFKYVLTTASDQVIFTRVNLCEKLVDHLRNISTKSQTSLKNYGILLWHLWQAVQ